MAKAKAKDFSFQNLAESYDKGFAGKISQKFYNLLLRATELTEGCVVLDVGCGTGALLRLMALQTQIVGYGIDTEEMMVAEAVKKCPGMNIQQFRSEKMPFKNESVDVITVCLAFHHFSDKEGFAAEAARVLKPGGVLYIADPRFPAPVRVVLNRVFRFINVAGEFNTTEEIGRHFSAHGFVSNGVVIESYAQVVSLRKN